ncbi:hypothetical protein [Moorena bouillonii]|nr:hypothetical protein [Moorena bouillonii]
MQRGLGGFPHERLHQDRVIILTSYKPKYYVLNYTFLATDRIIKIFIWLI